MIWKFANLWDGDSWKSNVFVTTNNQGQIEKLSNAEDSWDEDVPGWAVPGFQNAHSHAFQYAMAGLSEYVDPSNLHDDFWSWRTKMYDLALAISPDQLETIATQLYMDMLRNGYTWVAEFHYLHHSPEGTPYNNLSEMGKRLLAAAEKAGMGITLIPIFYQRGGFQKDALKEQRRFLSPNTDAYLQLVEATSGELKGPRQKLGLGIHSLRAASGEAISQLVEEAPTGFPWHIHIAEQVAEIEECEKHLGKRPVQWLLENFPVDERWNLVHATHTNSTEVIEMAERHLNVVLCPTTEANLGDGMFSLSEYWQQDGHWCVGSDSHIGISPMEELRWADYVQRLQSKKRNPLCRQNHLNSGELVFTEAWKSGRRAMGLSSSPLAAGESLDLVVVSEKTPLWDGLREEHRLSTLLYSTSAMDFSEIISGGQRVVRNGRHVLEEKTQSKWASQVAALRN